MWRPLPIPVLIDVVERCGAERQCKHVPVLLSILVPVSAQFRCDFTHLLLPVSAYYSVTVFALETSG